MIDELFLKQESGISNRTKLEFAVEHHKNFLLKGSSDDLINAINCYIEAIKENPEEASAYYHLAFLMFESKQISLTGAIEQCERAVQIEPINPDARMYLGYFLSLKGDKQRAKEELQKAIKLSPNTKCRARFIMAFELFEKRNFADIIKGACYITEGSVMSIFDRAAIKMFAGKVKQDFKHIFCTAKGALLEKLNLDKEAYKLYMEALDDTKDAPGFYRKMAKIAIKKDRKEVALQCFENAAQLSGNHPEAVIDVIEFIKEAYPDKEDELIDYYNALVSKLPKFSRAYYELGHLYLKKNDFLSASNAFRFALDNDENNPFYLNSLAFSYVQLEQYNSSVECYKKALEKSSDNEWKAVVSQALAAIYYKIQNNPKAALEVLETALGLTKNKKQIYVLFGDIYFDNENMKAAIKYYNLGLADGIRDSKVYSRLAMAYFEENFVKEAVDCYNNAILTDSFYEVPYNNLGVIYMDNMNEPNKALHYFLSAIKINPDYMLAHFNLGRCYAALNRKIEAAKEFQIAINLNKFTEELEETEIQEKIYKLFEA